jgi:uncharacterized membrane-anchored protein YitT (DUF2179 family)
MIPLNILIFVGGSMNRKLKKTINILLGSIIMSIGLYFFLIQNNIASGGVAGISLIFSQRFPIMTTGQWSLVLNILLLICAFKLVSFEFGANSTMSSIVVSLTLIVLEKLFPNVLITDNLLLNVFYGASIVSFSLALIFYNDGSSGGTDIIIAILNKYTALSLTISLLIVDSFVVLLAATEFGLEKAMYAILAVIIQTLVFNYFIQGFGRKIAIYVISSKNEEINEMILQKFDRGVTILKSQGGFSKKERNVVLTIVPFRDYIRIKDEIEKIDCKAFMFTHSISEVVGEGFTFDVFDN